MGVARLEGANLEGAGLEGAVFFRAELEGANLSRVRLEGADLRWADLRSSEWAGATFAASPVHSADLRGARNLTQAQINQLVGDKNTLLPEGLHVWSCWVTPPKAFNALVARAARWSSYSEDDLRRDWICPPGSQPQKTGTSLPLNAPRPEGHPLGQDRPSTGLPNPPLG
jgi:hypothetical protein